MPNLNKCYSLNDEDFNYSSFGEMLDAMASEDEPSVGRGYWEADCTTVIPRDAVSRGSVDSIIEDMEARLYDDIGECAADAFGSVTPEAKLELDALLLAWVEKNADLGRFWKIVGKTRECKLTAEDLV